MRDFVQDIRYGLRMMVKAPVVMAVAAISLAVGIAANTVTFSVANGFFFNPFPYAEQDRLVVVYENHQKSPEDEGASAGNYLDWRERATVFEELIAYEIVRANLTGGDEPERVRLVNASPETFGMMGRQPFIGRDFDADEGARRGVVMLSFPFWQRYFGEQAGILGDEITVDGVPHTVIGVMPEDFDFIPANVDVYRPTDWSEGFRRDDRDDRSLLVMGRLAEGRSIEAPLVDVGARDVGLERRDPLHGPEVAGHGGELPQRVAEEVGHDRHTDFTKQRELVALESLDADVLQPDGIEHPGGRLDNSRRDIARPRAKPEALGADGPKSREVHVGGGLVPVAEGAACGHDGILELQPRHLDRQVRLDGALSSGLIHPRIPPGR